MVAFFLFSCVFNFTFLIGPFRKVTKTSVGAEAEPE